MGASCSNATVSGETESAASASPLPATGACCDAASGSSSAVPNKQQQDATLRGEALLGASSSFAAGDPANDLIVKACALLEQGVDGSSEAARLTALRERLVNDIVKKIDSKVGVLSEFTVTVTTLGGQATELSGLRPDDTLSTVHTRWRKAANSHEGHLQFCIEDRALTQEDSSRPLAELGVGKGSVLTAVVVPDAKPERDSLVALCWLRDHATLNGTMVRVQEFDEDTQRYEVKSLNNGQLFRVRRENLVMKPADGEPQAPDGSTQLIAGTTVRLRGLRNDSGYNGLTGVVLSGCGEDDAANARYNLRLEDGTVKIAKLENLQVLPRTKM